MKEDCDYLFKVLVLGDSYVGKSSLVTRYAENVFRETLRTTVGADLKIKTIEMDGKTVKLELWDTAGQERFKAIASHYYRGAHGVLVVYDITCQKSFDDVAMWLKEVKRYVGVYAHLILVGNKSDLDAQRVVAYDTGKQCADKLGIPFLETSAKSTANVEEAFLKMASEIRIAMGDTFVPSGGDQTVNISQTQPVNMTWHFCC